MTDTTTQTPALCWLCQEPAEWEGRLSDKLDTTIWSCKPCGLQFFAPPGEPQETAADMLARLAGCDTPTLKALAVKYCAENGITLDGEPILYPDTVWDDPGHPTLSLFRPVIRMTATDEVLAVMSIRQIYNCNDISEQHINKVMAGEADLFGGLWQPPTEWQQERWQSPRDATIDPDVMANRYNCICGDYQCFVDAGLGKIPKCRQ